MNTYELSRQKVDIKELLKKTASVSHASHLIVEPGIYLSGGQIAFIYGKLSGPHDRMLWALKSLNYSPDRRTTEAGRGSGFAMAAPGREIVGESRVFGFRPRISINANYCGPCASALSYPEQSKTLCEFGRLLASFYRELAPDVFERHMRLIKKVRPEWVIEGTPFTQGIANRNNSLKYHFDRGNFDELFSCMVVFKSLVSGGDLILPEFDARLALDDRSYLLFDGQRVLHGVTPVKPLNRNGYRFSVVYYTQKSMEKCGTLQEELTRARIEKRQREKRRL